jgi:hypothetical protein
VASHNVARVANSVYLRPQGTREIDGGEVRPVKEEAVQVAPGIVVPTYDLAGIIDRLRNGVGRTRKIDTGEAR